MLFAVSACVPMSVELSREFAKKYDVSPVVYYNELLNSPLAIIPLRISFEPESTENATAEVNRLLTEIERSEAGYFTPPGFFDKVKVQFKGIFSM